VLQLTGKFADKPTRGESVHRMVNSQTSQLADSTHGAICISQHVISDELTMFFCKLLGYPQTLLLNS